MLLVRARGLVRKARAGALGVLKTSRIHPGSLNLDAHHFSSALSRSFMAAISWRTSSYALPVLSFVHATPASPSRVSVHLAACCVPRPGGFCRGPAQAPCPPASLRLMAAVPCRAASSASPHCLDGFASPCRAADRDGDVVEQEGECEGLSFRAPRNGVVSESTAREGNDFERDNAGGIHVIIGPMFAGKTTALLRRIRKEADAGRYSSIFLKI